MDRSDTKALVGALQEAVATTMTEAGWETDRAVGGDAEDIGAFQRAVNDDFHVSAAFYQYPGEPPSVIVAHFSVALVYEPAERLAESLHLAKTGWAVSAADLIVGIEDTANEPVPADGPAADRDRDAAHDDDCYEGDQEDVVLTTIADVPRAAGELTSPVLERAVAWATPQASVDAFLEFVSREVGDPSDWRLTRPLVLASAGRLDEAKACLVADLAGVARLSDLQFSQSAIATLTRWLADGSIPDARTGRSDATPDGAETPSLLRELNRGRARRAADDAVRAQRAGRSRNDLRAMLLAELAARDVYRSPRAVEMSLDVIEADTRGAKFRLGVSALKQLVDLGKEIRTILGSTDSDRFADPFRPPPNATYPAGVIAVPHRLDDRWIAADLVPDPGGLLEPILDAAQSPVQRTAAVHPWFSWESDPSSGGRSLAVHIGADRVATLPEDQVGQYRRDMEEAASLGLQPFTVGRVTGRDRPPHYLLEIAKP